MSFHTNPDHFPADAIGRRAEIARLTSLIDAFIIPTCLIQRGYLTRRPPPVGPLSIERVRGSMFRFRRAEP